MDATKSKISCPFSPLVIKKTFFVPVEFTEVSKEYNEESIIKYFRESTIKHKHALLKTCFKPDILLQNHPFPVDSNLFNEETQCVITLMSQFIGLDIDKYVTEPLMSLLFSFSTGKIESEQSGQSV